MAVADCLETIRNWQPSDNFGHAEWIHQQFVEVFLKKRASQIQKARKKKMASHHATSDGFEPVC